METRAVRAAVIVVCALRCFTPSAGELNPRGRNVCEYTPGHFQCCSGWTHLAEECSVAICDGNFTCAENEVCVRPNECRCRHGYFGATCDMKCPAQFWGPDCKGSCACYPHGRCDDVTGSCTCLPDRWGARCQQSCGCRKGACDQGTGACTCQPGFWGKQCSKPCACSGDSLCDVTTGQCRCGAGWFGRACDRRCACNGAPCEQLTGRCQCGERRWGGQCERACQCVHGRCSQADGTCACGPGYRGKLCREPCPAGSYGQNCRSKCGHCKGQQPCKVTEGLCVTCDRGWNGSRCDQKCASGFFGENCQEVCPACKDGHFCSRVDGACPHCNPGWIGDRCDIRCPNATYGDNCASACQDCFNGMCHFVTGECVCDPGFHGPSCNGSCPAGHYGVNCSQTCSCYENDCNPVRGTCNLHRNRRAGLAAAGLLLSLLVLLLLSLLCWGFLRRHVHRPREKKAKQRLFGGFTRIGCKLPRVPLRRQKLPNILVSHHDPENTLDCSFIETPSSGDHQPSPCCSSRGSCCSSRGSCCAAEGSPVPPSPHANGKESQSIGERSDRTETTLLLSGEEDPAARADPVPQVSAGITEPCSDAPGGLTPPRAGSDLPGGPPGSVTPSAPRHEGPGGSDPLRENTRSKARDRVKPTPPDPSTKPRASWIHRSRSPKRADAAPRGAKSSEGRTGPEPGPAAVSLTAGEPGTRAEHSTATRGPSGFLPLEPISRAMQSVLRQIRHTDGTPAASKTLSGEPPDERSQPSARNKKEPGRPGSREDPPRSSPVLTPSGPQNGDSPLSKASSPGTEGSRNVRKGSPTHLKTTTKYTVQRQDAQEGHVDSGVNVNE